MDIMIGLGSGRCGTLTLSRLIDKQKKFNATHQTFYQVATWEFNKGYFNRIITHLKRGRSDVSFYNLPYVKKFWEVFPELKVVCLKRDRDETIKSYVIRSENRNPWTSADSVYWKKYKWRRDSVWSKCYPKFDTPKEEAIGKYWDLYYDIAEKLEKDNPKRFKIYDMYDALNSEEHQINLLKFIGVEENEMEFILNKKYNTGKWKRNGYGM